MEAGREDGRVAPARLVAIAVRQLPALGVAVLAVAALSGPLRSLDLSEVVAALRTVSPAGALAALLLAAVSFAAAARYDALVHRLLRTGRPRSEAQLAGVTAVAISQTTGFGLLVGALVRLRMLPGLSLARAVALTAAAAALFLAGWAVVTSLALVALPAQDTGSLQPWAWLVLASVPAVLALACLQPRFSIAGRRLRIPPVGLMLSLLVAAAVDTIAAGLCLWVLLPPDAGLSFGQLLPAFLVAFGAGLVSGVPGGLGAFEVTLLALLPGVEAEPLLAAVLAWRVVFYAIPAGLGIGLLARGARLGKVEPMARPVDAGALTPDVRAELDLACRAEFGLIRQGDKSYLDLPRGGAVAARAGQTLALIGSPSARDAHGADVIGRLVRAARAEAAIPCLYKAPARLAAAARRASWMVFPVALDAWIVPAAFRSDAPGLGQLRRKLRKATSQGVTVRRAGPDLPWDELARVAQAWSSARGGERGFSTGRFARDYVSGQMVYLALRDGRLVAFLTLHDGAHERCIDLMRATDEAPDGTMHALVCAALQDASADGVARFSLAALPHPRFRSLIDRLPERLRRSDSTPGLTQFKLCFQPNLSPLYLAAPGRLGLLFAAFDIHRAIRHPEPFGAAHPRGGENGPATATTEMRAIDADADSLPIAVPVAAAASRRT